MISGDMPPLKPNGLPEHILQLSPRQRWRIEPTVPILNYTPRGLSTLLLRKDKMRVEQSRPISTNGVRASYIHPPRLSLTDTATQPTANVHRATIRHATPPRYILLNVRFQPSLRGRR